MLTRNRISIGLFVIFLCSCASLPKQRSQVSFDEIDQMRLGTSPGNVVKILGSPQAVRELNGETIWIYDSPRGDRQRASISFDPGNRLVSKTLIPIEAEPEIDLEFILKNRFPKNKFQSVAFPQCGMDYISGSALYADIDAGVSILYRKRQRDVEAIAWTTPAQLNQDIIDIEKCKGRIMSEK